MQTLVVFIFIVGFISSLAERNLLLNICFQSGSHCRSNDSYLKLTPTYFDSNKYNYTIHIPNNYSFYKSTGPMQVEFYVIMNVSDTDAVSYKKSIVAKSVLFNVVDNKVLASTDLSYFPNEMLVISAQLWQPKNQIIISNTENEFITKLIVYRLGDSDIQQSDPYILTFKRNE